MCTRMTKPYFGNWQATTGIAELLQSLFCIQLKSRVQTSFIKMVKGMWPLFILYMRWLNIVIVYKPGKVWKAVKSAANHVFIVSLGRYCSPRSSSRQKGRSYQAIRWGYQGEAIPPCYCCWNRTLPTKSDETYGSEKVSPQEQSETIHQSMFFTFVSSGLNFSIVTIFRWLTIPISFLHVTPSNWRAWKAQWLLNPSKTHHSGKIQRRRLKSC